MVIPSKLLTYMAAGRTVIAAVNSSSEAADCIRQADCGLMVPPEDAEALANGIRQMHRSSEGAKRAANSGRAFVEREFAREGLLERCEQMLLEVAQIRREKQEAALRAP